MNLIEQLLWSQTGQSLVAQVGQAQLHSNAERYWLYTSGEAIQSVYDRQHPQLPMLPYQRLMLSALTMLDNLPRRVLNLGIGIGAFERSFAAVGVELDYWHAVEIDQDIVKLLNQQLPLPESVSVFEGDAFEILKQVKTTYDLILCDLFIGQHHAEVINHQSFFQYLRQNLADQGVVAINLAPSSAGQMTQLLSFAKLYFHSGSLVNFPPFGNVVMCLSTKPQLSLQDCLGQIARLQPLWSLPFTEQIQPMHFF